MWVEDGYVYVEGHNGVTFVMTPEVAIAMGRFLSEAGAKSSVDKLMRMGAAGA